MAGDPPLRMQRVNVRFPGFGLKDVDLVVERGFVTGFVGVNGSGKTTTIKTALGMIRPVSGTIECVPRSRIGVVLDTPLYPPSWTSDDVARALRPFYPTWEQQRYEQTLDRLEVPRATRLHAMSRGQGVKLMTAAALAHGPELLLLDEPTGGLDPVARSTYLDVLTDYLQDEDRSILYSTHITSDLDRIADHIVIIDDGRILLAAPTDELVDAFRIVRGTGEALPHRLRAHAFGLREYEAGWEALLPAGDADDVTDAVVERPDLEAVVIHLAKGPSYV